MVYHSYCDIFIYLFKLTLHVFFFILFNACYVIVGNLPLFFSRIGSVPSADISKEVSGEVGDGPKPCCRCLGRDTISNAAARVGPAVVNLSVPQGIFCGFS